MVGERVVEVKTTLRPKDVKAFLRKLDLFKQWLPRCSCGTLMCVLPSVFTDDGSTTMSTRTVRLDEEAEETLERLRNLTGLSISDVLKRGLSAYESEATSQAGRSADEIYAELDLGEGGYALAPATEAKRAVKDALRRKHQR